MLLALLVVVVIFGLESVSRISSGLVISLILMPKGLLLAAGICSLAGVEFSVVAEVVVVVLVVVVPAVVTSLEVIDDSFLFSASSRSSASISVSFSSLDSPLGEVGSAMLEFSRGGQLSYSGQHRPGMNLGSQSCRL